MQQRSGGTEPTLPHEAWQEGERRRSLRASRCRRQRYDGDHKRDRAVTGDYRRQDEHEDEAHHASGHEHRAAGMTIRERASERSEEHVRKQAGDRRGTDPRGRVSGTEDVAQERRVVEPVADL